MITEVTKFKTTDGSEFESKQVAEAYEQQYMLATLLSEYTRFSSTLPTLDVGECQDICGFITGRLEKMK